MARQSLINTEQITKSVGMGEIVIVSHGQIAKAVLGSCVGLVLYDQLDKTAAVAHIVLSESRGIVPSQPGKFADTAINHMLTLLSNRGIPASRLAAKLAGGANMFGSTGPMQIGRINCEAVQTLLHGKRIAIAGEHLGGDKGRRIEFDSNPCSLKIESANQPQAML